MARKSRRPCTFPGCPELVAYGRCEKHRSKKRANYGRMKIVDPFYKSAAWLKARAMYLRSHPICEVCQREYANTVHHVQAIKDGGARLAFDNLMSICPACHNRVHKRKAS